MSAWWSYGLSDFLMFAPATYWRLVELHNRASWPLPVLGIALGVAACFVAARRRAGGERLIALVLAAAWCWVGWGFFFERLAQIHLAAPYLAAAAFAQGAGLAVAAFVPSPAAPQPAHSTIQRIALAWALAAILLYPAVGSLAGRPLVQAEVFGMMPDPTAWGTLGLLASMARPRWQRAALAVLPLLFLLAGAVHHASMAQ